MPLTLRLPGRQVDLDQELVDNLEASRPQLKAALDCYKAVTCNGSFGRSVTAASRKEQPPVSPRAQLDPVSGESAAQVKSIAGQVAAAASQKNREDLKSLLQRGFDLARPLIAGPQTPGARALVDGLAPMVQIGAQTIRISRSRSCAACRRFGRRQNCSWRLHLLSMRPLSCLLTSSSSTRLPST